MGNANTERSKKLRAESSIVSLKKMIAEGGLSFSVKIRKEHGADLLKELAEKHGGKAGAIRFLLDFYQKNGTK